jgi:hypothetical protein
MGRENGTVDSEHSRTSTPGAPMIATPARLHDSPAPTVIDATAPGSPLELHAALPGRRHPAEIVVAALLAGRAVELPDGKTYRLGEDLTLGVGRADDSGFVFPRDLAVGVFLRLCGELSAAEVFNIGCDTALAALGRRARTPRPAAAA